jgi:AcrR family transcriptional regulator
MAPKSKLKIVADSCAETVEVTEKRRPYARTFENRRGQILATAWVMIAESNGADFTLQELSTRCDVSLRTIYNAFSDKDGVIAAAAAANHHKSFEGIFLESNDSMTLVEAVEITRRVAADTARVPGWSAASVEMYFSPRSCSRMTESLRQMPISILKAWLRSPEVDERLVKLFGHFDLEKAFADMQWGAVADWCAGRIDKHDMSQRMVSSLLTIAAAFGNRAGRATAKQLIAK